MDIGKTALLQTLVCGSTCGVCKCAVLCSSVSLSLRGGEKKQNKFPSNCTALSTENQSSQSVFCNYFNLFISCQCVEFRFFYTCIQRRKLHAGADCGRFPVKPKSSPSGKMPTENHCCRT